MTNIRAWASKIAKLEGKKSEARVGDIREQLSIESDIVFKELNASANFTIPVGGFVDSLYMNGKRRAQRKDRSKK